MENNDPAANNVTKDEGEDQQQPPRKEDWEIQRDEHKALGDAAFRTLGYRTAIDEYSKAISVDPENVVLYSNRSAAYLKNGEKSKALRDAEKCVGLDPKFAKGHSRLAAALYALTRYTKAQDCYKEVLRIDPNNAVAKKGVDDCQKALDLIKEREEKAKRDGYQQQQYDVAAKEEREQVKAETGKESSGAGGDDEDDLLNDFFDDVEEVVTKKKEGDLEQLEKQPEATNVIKNQKVELGTSESQMERLLRSNYEWRNLNPFYVLQLPSSASEEDISKRYKALSLLLHPDKNGGSDRAQTAYDQVQKAKLTLSDEGRARHSQQLVEEGMRQGNAVWKKMPKAEKQTNKLEDIQEREVMRIFAQVEHKRREVEQRERKYEQREQQQEDEALDKERKQRQFDKKWRNEERVDKRVGNWRDFASNKKRKSDK